MEYSKSLVSKDLLCLSNCIHGNLSILVNKTIIPQPLIEYKYAIYFNKYVYEFIEFPIYFLVYFSQ